MVRAGEGGGTLADTVVRTRIVISFKESNLTMPIDFASSLLCGNLP